MIEQKRNGMRKSERGQVLPMVAVMVVGMMGMCAFVIDVGRVYISDRQLQASTDAAALAGAEMLPGSTAASTAINYSSVPGNLNAYSSMSNVSMVSGYPQIKCLSTLTGEGIACVAPANGNAIVVKQQASVPMFFARLFGTSTVTLTATATAAMRGGITNPYNVAIIVDTTGSMSDTDSGDCNASRLYCAMEGVRVLLADLSPCGSSQTTCGTATNGNVTNSVDRVSLFTFPNIVSTTASYDYDCSSTNPTINPYTFPSPTATSLSTMPYTTGSGSKATTVQMTYQVLDFSSDYRTSDTISTLNTNSNLVLASNGKTSCIGMENPGGDGTYYAAALYQAQSALLAEQAANPGSLNVMILLSDGDASATSAKMATGTESTTVATSNGTYPSWVNQCQQAVTAAAAITAAGTKIYSVAYGAAATDGCATDTGTYAGNPCLAMQNIASGPSYFFSDYTATQNSGQCISASQPTTSLNQIFTQIAGDFTTARLIPDNTQ